MVRRPPHQPPSMSMKKIAAEIHNYLNGYDSIISQPMRERMHHYVATSLWGERILTPLGLETMAQHHHKYHHLKEQLWES